MPFKKNLIWIMFDRVTIFMLNSLVFIDFQNYFNLL